MAKQIEVLCQRSADAFQAEAARKLAGDYPTLLDVDVTDCEIACSVIHGEGFFYTFQSADVVYDGQYGENTPTVIAHYRKLPGVGGLNIIGKVSTASDFAQEIRDQVEPGWVDEGIGEYECHGHKGTHIDWQFNCGEEASIEGIGYTFFVSGRIPSDDDQVNVNAVPTFIGYDDSGSLYAEYKVTCY